MRGGKRLTPVCGVPCVLREGLPGCFMLLGYLTCDETRLGEVAAAEALVTLSISSCADAPEMPTRSREKARGLADVRTPVVGP